MQQCSAALIFINRPHYMFRFGHECSEVVYCKDFNVFESHGVTDIHTIFNVMAVKLSRHMKVVAAPVAWNVKVVASGARALRQVRGVVLESFSCHLASKRCSSNSSSFTWKFRGSWKSRQAVLVQALTEASRQLLFSHYNKIVDINIAITRDSYSS